jgi:hypothetical protein
LGIIDIENNTESKMLGINWNNVVWIATIQLLSIVMFGFFYCEFIKLKQPVSPSISFFKPGEYNSNIADDPDVAFQTPPKWFRFVIVQREDNGQVSRESFYTILGDETIITFSEGIFSGLGGNLYSNYIFIGTSLAGMGLIAFLSLLNSPVLLLTIGDQHYIFQGIARFGVELFFSTFISSPFKMIFDFANHLNLSVLKE